MEQVAHDVSVSKSRYYSSRESQESVVFEEVRTMHVVVTVR